MTHRILRVVLLLCLIPLTASAATFTTGGPHTTNNDDSCDISLLPAATLLIPYFEVDLSKPSGAGETTLITVTNVSHEEQALSVTLWTDYGFPAMTFHVYLTGYDVQSLNLYDIIKLGQIAPTRGTGFEDTGSPEGDFSDDNPRVDENSCRNLPMQLPSVYLTRMQQAFTAGTVPALGNLPACSNIGGTHVNAVGYATIDVVRKCDGRQPHEPAYFTDTILFDNVLMGEYLQVNGIENSAQGAPAVHVRAIPEGGTAAQRLATPASYIVNFARTFYGRFQSNAAPSFDARQPLPSLFAARYIDGGAGSFATTMKIWREGEVGSGPSCAPYANNKDGGVTEVVRFDEEENLNVLSDPICCILPYDTTLPVVSRFGMDNDDVFPPPVEDEIAGWLYVNLDDPERVGASQAWIVSSMRAEGRFSVDADVVALGNGCTPPTVGQSEANADGGPIGPAPNVNP